MKTIRCLSAMLFQFVVTSVVVGQEPAAYQDYARLLKRYVVDTGVDYAGWHANADDVDALRGVVDAFAAVDVNAFGAAEQKAFYINLYNAAMLQVVLEHYPLQSVTEILPGFGIFKRQWIELGDLRLSLDDIEKGILLKQYSDPRIHFAVNCASRSCPPLAAMPFRAANLDEQLDIQTRAFAHSDEAVIIDELTQTLKFSQLLQWYANDFGDQGPVYYLNRYRKSPLPKGYKIAWIQYNWSLNEHR